MVPIDIMITSIDFGSTPKRLWVAWGGHLLSEFPKHITLFDTKFTNAGKLRDHIVYEAIR